MREVPEQRSIQWSYMVISQISAKSNANKSQALYDLCAMICNPLWYEMNNQIKQCTWFDIGIINTFR